MAPSSTTKPKAGPDAGLRLSRPQDDVPHPAGPPQHGPVGQAERAFTIASTFLSGILAINASQLMGAPLKLIDPQFYEGYMAYTKESFAILITCLTQWWAPTTVRVSGDASMKGQLIQLPNGDLKCAFPDRLVLMANHQLYTDWLYLWWIAYTAGQHGHIYIVLKESLRNVPLIGWGARFYNFIFLSRDWERDQATFRAHLAHLAPALKPMWLLIFPEGTNLSASTRAKSAAYASKQGLQDMKHLLLPRSTGLRFCLQQLAPTTEYLYDATIAYEGIPPGHYGQDIFTLKSSFLEGRPPKAVNIHWRRFRLADVPHHDEHAFDVWLRNRWREKDYLLEYFARHQRFPADEYWRDRLPARSSASSASTTSSSSKARLLPPPRHAAAIETQVRSGNWEEFLRIFTPLTAVSTAVFMAYGASPQELPFASDELMAQQLPALLKQATQGRGGKEVETLLKSLGGKVDLKELGVGDEEWGSLLMGLCGEQARWGREEKKKKKKKAVGEDGKEGPGKALPKLARMETMAKGRGSAAAAATVAKPSRTATAGRTTNLKPTPKAKPSAQPKPKPQSPSQPSNNPTNPPLRRHLANGLVLSGGGGGGKASNRHRAEPVSEPGPVRLANGVVVKPPPSSTGRKGGLVQGQGQVKAQGEGLGQKAQGYQRESARETSVRLARGRGKG